MSNTVKFKYADEKQKEVYKKFAPASFLGNPQTMDNFMLWITFFRRNLHRLAIDYLGLKLHLYQIIMLYLMGINRFIVVIASRASAKSWVIALYACCRCILYPNSMIVLSSSTKGQSKLLVSEKIQKELMRDSPALRKEIRKIKDNQNEVIVYFKNHSTITVVPASENGRGYRSNVIVREEFRQIKKSIDDSILSPFQIIRQTPYMKDPYYEKIEEIEEAPVDIYISSSWLDNGHWMWNIVDQAYEDMLKDKPSCLLAFDESIAIKHKIKPMSYFQSEKRKQDPMTWQLEFLNLRLKENQSAYFTYAMLQKNQRSKQPFYPRLLEDFKAGKRNKFDIPKQQGEIRIVACDMAFISGKSNDKSAFSCMRLIPELVTYTLEGERNITMENSYRRIVPYIEAIPGGDTVKQAIRIRQLYEDFQSDYIVLDMRNAGCAIFDKLARVMYDDERGVEYSPLTCMNDEKTANRVTKTEGAKPCIFVINATEKLNSEIAQNFHIVLNEEKIDLLIPFEQAKEQILADMKEYTTTPDAYRQIFYEAPFLETQSFISETTSLLSEKKVQTGALVVYEASGNRKDRYTSVSYASYFADLLEKDLLSKNEDYQYTVLIN